MANDYRARWLGVAGVCLSCAGVACSSQSDSPSPTTTSGPLPSAGAKVGSVAQRIGGKTTAPNPEVVGVVRITPTVPPTGSGFIWQSFSTPAPGSFVITVRHILSEADEMDPSGLTVQLGSQSATAVFVARYPTTDADVGIIRLNKQFVVNGTSVFKRNLFSGDDSLLNSTSNTQLNCYGYDGTTTLRWGWFYGTGYVPISSIPPSHIITVSSFKPPYDAFIQGGDSGGPCFDGTSTVIGLVQLGVPPPTAGGNITAIDSEVRSFLQSHTF
jgi:hypothetical protein